jgi:hypothetical protein
MDLRASNASPRRGGTFQPREDALALPAPLCVVAAWTRLAVPGAEEQPDKTRAKELAAIDAELGTLLDRLHARPGFAGEEWLVVVTGLAPAPQQGKKAPAATERAHTGVPLCLTVPGVAAGELRGEVLLADVVPTALAHLGVEPRKSFALDGVPLALAREARYGTNLITNGGAEAQLGWSTGPLAQLAGWRQLAPFARGRHAPGEPGARARGQSFFQGAGGEHARAEQRLDLGAFAADIARGGVRYRFGALLGTRGGGTATIECALELLDERGKVLDRVVLASKSDADGLEPHVAADDLPRRTRAARVVLLAEGGDVRQAMADELELVLERE